MNSRRKTITLCAVLIFATAVQLGSPARAVETNDATQTELLASIAALKDHLQGKKTLDAKQIEDHKLTLDKHKDLFGYNGTLIKACLDLVATYDKVEGPLWLSGKSFNRGRRRNPTPPANDIHWTIYNVMQNIMDQVYTKENVAQHRHILDGFKFGSSAHFPGAVEPPSEPDEIYEVKINASNPKTWGRDSAGPARKATGAYLAPGTIATITVPKALVDTGYEVRVGAHSWDHSSRPRALRLDRSSLVYPIDAAETQVASPLGGGIYIEVPDLADAGVVKGERPERGTHFVRDALDYAASHHQFLGIHDYDWKPVEPQMQTGTWDYFTFDDNLPAEMKNWFAPDFDAKQAGFKSANAPFGQSGGEKVALRPDSCTQSYYGCGITPGTLWDKKELLMRQTFDLPAVQKGHRYRIVVGGACHVNSGAGYSVYINGKLLGRGGDVKVRQGGQPRGAHIYPDLMPELESGKVTIAVTSSLRYNAKPSPRGHLSVILEVQKIPEELPAMVN